MSQRARGDDQQVRFKGPEQGFRRRATLFGRRGRGKIATVFVLYQIINHQADRENKNQRLDAFWFVQEYRRDRNGCFQLMVRQFAVCLTLVFRERFIRGRRFARQRRQDGGNAVADRIAIRDCGVVRILETMCWAALAGPRRGKGVGFILAQRNDPPGEILRRLAAAQGGDRATLDRPFVRVATALGDGHPQGFQVLPHATNVLPSRLLGGLFAGGAEYENQATGNAGFRLAVVQLVPDFGQFVMFQRQRRTTVATPLLLDRTIACFAPIQRGNVLFVERPGLRFVNRADDVHVVGQRPFDVLKRIRAGIGNHHRPVDRYLLSEQSVVIGDARHAVLISTLNVNEHWNAAIFVGCKAEAGVNDFGNLPHSVDTSPLGDMCRRQSVGNAIAPIVRHYIRPRFAALIFTIKRNMCWIKMQFIQRYVELLCHMNGDAAKNGMPMFEEVVQGASDAIVVNPVGINVEHNVRAGVRRPLGDPTNRRRLVQPRGNQQRQHLSRRHRFSPVRLQVPINNPSHPGPIQQRYRQREIPDIASLRHFGISEPSKPHAANYAAKGRAAQTAYFNIYRISNSSYARASRFPAAIVLAENPTCGKSGKPAG